MWEIRWFWFLFSMSKSQTNFSCFKAYAYLLKYNFSLVAFFFAFVHFDINDTNIRTFCNWWVKIINRYVVINSDGFHGCETFDFLIFTKDAHENNNRISVFCLYALHLVYVGGKSVSLLQRCYYQWMLWMKNMPKIMMLVGLTQVFWFLFLNYIDINMFLYLNFGNEQNGYKQTKCTDIWIFRLKLQIKPSSYN